ncbi:FCD domain-containing protein [Microbacterium sp. ARD32]|uniref:GntR family transcriptional regulator n=1 Tax=Microbacterium sp. ARD32 TaxID=2962577 RepID=UPI002882B354|nr:FCD domain-containing protein [Microbacterium sp. ARD32]MDT0157944.1 FCD domain-containing protein [Microbacterium sp. ARD32]
MVRAELEGLAAEMFARYASDEEVAKLVAAFGQVELAARTENLDVIHDVMHAKDRLYGILFQGAGNPILTQMVGILQRRVTQFRALTLAQPGRPVRSVEEITVVVDAIRRRDAESARAAATLHVHEAARTVLGAIGHVSAVSLHAQPVGAGPGDGGGARPV